MQAYVVAIILLATTLLDGVIADENIIKKVSGQDNNEKSTETRDSNAEFQVYLESQKLNSHDLHNQYDKIGENVNDSITFLEYLNEEKSPSSNDFNELGVAEAKDVFLVENSTDFGQRVRESKSEHRDISTDADQFAEKSNYKENYEIENSEEIPHEKPPTIKFSNENREINNEEIKKVPGKLFRPIIVQELPYTSYRSTENFDNVVSSTINPISKTFSGQIVQSLPYTSHRSTETLDNIESSTLSSTSKIRSDQVPQIISHASFKSTESLNNIVSSTLNPISSISYDHDQTNPLILNSIQAGVSLINSDSIIASESEKIEEPTTAASMVNDEPAVEVQKSVEIYHSGPVHEIHYYPVSEVKTNFVKPAPQSVKSNIENDRRSPNSPVRLIDFGSNKIVENNEETFRQNNNHQRLVYNPDFHPTDQPPFRNSLRYYQSLVDISRPENIQILPSVSLKLINKKKNENSKLRYGDLDHGLKNQIGSNSLDRDQIHEGTIESPANSNSVEKLYEKTVHMAHPLSVERLVEKQVTIPQPFPIPIHVPVQIPVDRVIEKQVTIPQPYPIHVEKLVEKRIPIPIHKIILQPVPVHVKMPQPMPYAIEKQVRVPMPIEKIVEKKVHVPHPYPVEVEKILVHGRPLPIEVMKYLLLKPIQQSQQITYQRNTLQQQPLQQHQSHQFQPHQHQHQHQNQHQYHQHQHQQQHQQHQQNPQYQQYQVRQENHEIDQYYNTRPIQLESRAGSIVNRDKWEFPLANLTTRYSSLTGHARIHDRKPAVVYQNVASNDFSNQFSRQGQVKDQDHSSVSILNQEEIYPRRTRQPQTIYMTPDKGNFRQSKMEYGFKPPMIPSVQYDEKTATKVDN